MMARRTDELDNLSDEEAGHIRRYLRHFAADPKHHALVRYLRDMHGEVAWQRFGVKLPESWGPGALEEDPRPRPEPMGPGKDPTPVHTLEASGADAVSKRLYAAGLELQRLVVRRAGKLGVSYDEARQSLEQEAQAGSVMRYARSRPPTPRTPEEYRVAQQRAISLATRSGGTLDYDQALQTVLEGGR
jgi:hypothetical protein